METTLDVLARAFFEANPRLAVFDVDARRRAGFWEFDGRSIPVDEVVSLLDEYEAFHSGTDLLIPLHEFASAELTGGYLIGTRRDGVTYLGFYDFGTRSPRFLTSDEFAGTTFSLHLRYWHPDYRPPETPSYLAEHYDDDPASASPPVDPHTTGPVEQSFFEDVKLSITRERDAERARNRERFETQASTRSSNGTDQLSGLTPAGRRIDRDGGQICMLDLASGDTSSDVIDAYGIYPGAEAIVDTADQHAGFPVDAEISDVSEGRVHLRVKWSTSEHHGAAESAFDADSDAGFRIAPLVNPIPYDRQRAGVEAIEDDERKRAIVLGERSLQFDEDQAIGSRSRALNQYQRRAIRRALGATDVFCIHGPPGTGKTRTLVALVREAVHRGEKVLVSAHSNQAVDNLLVGTSTPDSVDRHSLHADAVEDEFVIARAGHNSSNPVVTEAYTDVESWEANVVGATTNAAHRFRTDEFDLVVVDEAAQSGIPSTMIPFAAGERLVLAGDHLQLPPFTSSESDAEERMQISLFEHLLNTYGDEAATLLRKQYRMNQRIAAFPNRAFYGDRLTHGQRNRDWSIRDLDPLGGIHVEGEEGRTPGGSYYNEREAAVVAREIDRLMRNGVPASRIGVITPYSGQVGKIVQALEEPSLEDRLAISTVDAFQGSERDAIVVSFVRSNDEGNTGFLTFPTEGPRRLNVAMTRAKKRCVLVGNWDTLRRTPAWRTDEDDASIVFDALHSHLVDAGVLVHDGVEAP